MTTKLKRSKRYHYASNLTSAFLRDVVPEQGGHYVGCRARLEADGDVIWAGHKALPVLVRNRSLKALILMPCDGTPMHGSMSCVSLMAISCRDGIQEQHLNPIEKRQSRWDWRRNEAHPGVNYTAIHVDRLTEDLATCSLSDLQQLVHNRVNRIMEGVSSNRWTYAHKFGYALTGNWGYYRRDGLTLSLGAMKSRFDELGLQWNEEWSRMALIASAKRKLTAS